MSELCHELHRLLDELKRFKFPFDQKTIPNNGVYVLYEKNELGHGNDRIVRIGTHTGNNQLRSRLKQHFLDENKDRCIFRKNIGRCLLNKTDDIYLKIWEYDLTSRKNKEKYSHLIDKEYQQKIEENISKYIQDNFSFVVINIEDKQERLRIKSGLISLVSSCNDCQICEEWLGKYSPKKKIRESGLWQVNELYKASLKFENFNLIKENGVRDF